MLAKMVLPLLGGTPAVWNTCMVFFQGMLLAGYAYAHWLSRQFSLRRQIVIQVGLMLVAALALPIGVSSRALASVPSQSNPIWWLLGCLLLSAGFPFFAVSANAPLLQRWFSRSSHPAARDPYFLYAASNVGSLIALLGYPLWVEPRLRLGAQSAAWAGLFLLLSGLILGCGLFLLWSGRVHSRGNSLAASITPAGEREGDRSESTPRRRWRWCILALIPSSLMLGVTTYLTTDIASIPLLWVLPLSLYLLTFVVVFSGAGEGSWRWAARVLPMGAVALAYMLLSEATQPAWILVPLHLVIFFLGALACHGRLAAERPRASNLTEFYLWISIGGVLGGLFNALAAPYLFSRVAEYPAALIAACWLNSPKRAVPGGVRRRWLDVGVPAGIALLTFSMFLLAQSRLPLQARLGLSIGLPLLACFGAVDRPVRFALSLAAVMLVSSVHPGIHGRPLLVERNFFGVLRVTQDPLGRFHRLVHGNTIHGRQWIDPARQQEPLSYYHRGGPLGQVFDIYRSHPAAAEVAVVGLGAGSMAAYAQPGERWSFYEINPAVVDTARDTNYFTFLSGCRADHLEIVLGDARLRLQEAPAHHFGLLVLDAFSSDAIPMHLITREALALYLMKLAPDGLLVFHISNRVLELEGVLGDLARDADLVCHAQDEGEPSALELVEGKDQSHWLVMARRREDLGRLTRDSRWLPIRGRSPTQVWTDDFSNILSVFHWE